MTEDKTPAGELRAAAAKLRKLAADCCEGRWFYQSGPPCAEVIAEEGGWIVASSRHIEDDSFRWIALLGPAIAEPLASMLDIFAERQDIRARVYADPNALPKEIRAALTFARSILGGTQ